MKFNIVFFSNPVPKCPDNLYINLCKVSNRGIILEKEIN